MLFINWGEGIRNIFIPIITVTYVTNKTDYSVKEIEKSLTKPYSSLNKEDKENLWKNRTIEMRNKETNI